MRVLLSLAGLALGLLLALILSQRALQGHWLQREARLDQAHAAGHSVLEFPLHDAGDLIGRQAQDVLDSHYGDDGLTLSLAPGAANLPLGFDGRCLRATHFPWLVVSYLSDQPLRLALVHAVAAGGEQRLSEVPLPAGNDRLRVDLRTLDWRAGGASGPGRTLGDVDGDLCEFRLVPVAAVSTRLRLSDLRFETDSDASQLPANTPIQLGWQRPATLLADRDAQIEHADQSWPIAPAWPPLLGSWAGWLAAISSAVALLLALLRGRRQQSGQRWTRAVVLLALLGWVLLLVELQPLASPPALASLTLGLAALLWLRPPSRGPSTHWLGTWAAWRSILPITTIVLLSAWLIGHWQGRAAPHWPAADDWLRYLLWAMLQQWLLQRVLQPVLSPVANRTTRLSWLAALPAAAAFAALHLPNFELAVLCLLAGLWWTRHFQRHHSWLPLITVHVLLGSLLPELLPPDWLYSAEVGARYPGLD